MTEPVASIVIPLLNQDDEWLKQSVLSALAQTVCCEVIVVTSRRTKLSNLAVLDTLRKQDERLLIMEERPRGGFAVGINTGIWRASTARIGLLLSDDWLDTSAVKECLKFSSDIVSTGAIAYNADCTKKIYDARLSMARFMQLPTLEAKASYLEHFFLFNRGKLLEVGGVDESVGLTGADDYDLIWTMLEHGASVSIVGKSLYNYRDHEGERLTLRSKDDQVRDLEKILDKHRVPDCEKRELIKKHSNWYGEPIYRVLARIEEDAGLNYRERFQR